MSASAGPGRFASTVAYYQRYRLGYPDRLLQRVASLLGLQSGDRVLDLGTGTGMLAVGFAKLGLAVTAMDPEPAMLEAAAAAARAAGVRISFAPGGSSDLGEELGRFRLVTMGRCFHWMDRSRTLQRLDGIVTGDGGVALFHDAHPPVHDNGWFKRLHAVQEKYAGVRGPDDRGPRGGHRRYEPFLFASAFTRLDGLSVIIRQPLTVEEIVGRAFSMSTSSPQRLGTKMPAFAQDLSAALRELSADGTFMEVAEMVALLARRPEQGV